MAKSWWTSWTTKFSAAMAEGIYFADKRTLLPLNQHFRNLDRLRLQFGRAFPKDRRWRLPPPMATPNSYQHRHVAHPLTPSGSSNAAGLLPRHRQEASSSIRLKLCTSKSSRSAPRGCVHGSRSSATTQIESKTDANPSLPAPSTKGPSDRGEHHRDGETFRKVSRGLTAKGVSAGIK